MIRGEHLGSFRINRFSRSESPTPDRLRNRVPFSVFPLHPAAEAGKYRNGTWRVCAIGCPSMQTAGISDKDIASVHQQRFERDFTIFNPTQRLRLLETDVFRVQLQTDPCAGVTSINGKFTARIAGADVVNWDFQGRGDQHRRGFPDTPNP